MMPDDLLKPLSDVEARALIAYLASPKQAPVLATKDTLATFFNGKDLAGWEGKPELWRVENGEIVGTSKGLARNELLVNHLLLGGSRMSLKVKLVPSAGCGGTQVRSDAPDGGEVRA